VMDERGWRCWGQSNGCRRCVRVVTGGSDPVLASWLAGNEGDRLLLCGLVEANVDGLPSCWW
jgi:hypothetical protein